MAPPATQNASQKSSGGGQIKEVRGDKVYNCCHQMSYFKAKMHQIRFRLELRPRPRWGSSQRFPSAPPDPLAGFKGSYF